jgi:hypothetical protein
MRILYRRPPLRCNAPASLAGQALRSDSAFLIGVGLQWVAYAIMGSQQPALITDSQRAVRKLMNHFRATAK